MDLENVQDKEGLKELIDSQKWYRIRKVLKKEGIIDSREYRKIGRCGSCKLSFIRELKEWVGN